MCGIAGFISFGGHDREAADDRVHRMTDTLVHRGPDAEGHHVDDRVALGHRRLSIIDRSGGHQPMGTAEGDLTVVFNGEIYNFPELRRELEALGHDFRTRSDTEVILLGYREWGDGVVRRLNGMFAFALWDAPRRCALLARDRVGKKPLYYAWDGHRLAFASELKALLAGGFVVRDLDPRAMDCYFTFGYIPAPMTVFRGARKLLAAHQLTATDEGLAERPYWSLSFGATRQLSLGEAAEEFESVLDEAVRCRLMSEVPLGAFLSGGLDSTLVVSSMARALDGPVLTNSIGFGEKQWSELPVARAVAQHLHTDHREFVVEPDAAGVLEQIAWHFDEPFADSSALPTWYVCQMARQNVTVALSGDGGDEGFGGYTFRYVPHLAESKIRRAFPGWFRARVFGALGGLWPASARLPRPLRLKTIFENLGADDATAFCADLAWLRMDTRERLYTPEFKRALDGFAPYQVVRPLYEGSPAEDPVGRSQETDAKFYMTDDVLVKVDRMSMAHSLEVRCPLLDHRVLEFGASLPLEARLQGGKGKMVIRELARRRLPRAVLDQPKRGFSIPAAEWLRGDLRDLAAAAIFDSSGAGELLDGQQLRRVWDEHQAGARNHSVLLWGMMMFGLWQTNYRGAGRSRGGAQPAPARAAEAP